ncbi:MAG: hypothetical protein KDK11_04155, partial [Maritimibacter sp.]|nr:hypothetical protein [Maritimibacter sp.]
ELPGGLRVRAVPALAVALAFASPASGATLDCEFGKSCGFDPDCRDAALCFREAKCRTEKGFSFRIEYEEGSPTATIFGNNGTSAVEVHSGGAGKTFLEHLPSGSVQVTTVANSGQAVHSRQTMFYAAPEILPSQYYGNCEVVE